MQVRQNDEVEGRNISTAMERGNCKNRVLKQEREMPTETEIQILLLKSCLRNKGLQCPDEQGAQ
jgi:hypothetical protein